MSARTKGNLYRRTADLTTRVTTAVSLGLAANIATDDTVRHLDRLPSFQSWGMMVTMGAIALADKVDGIFARAAARNGRPITKKDKDRDPFHDKLRYHALTSMSALTLAQSNVVVGTLIAAIEVPIAVRDARITWQRYTATEETDTAATTFTKAKTGLLNTALIETVSPATLHPAGEVVAATLHGLGALAAVSSGSLASKKQPV